MTLEQKSAKEWTISELLDLAQDLTKNDITEGPQIENIRSKFDTPVDFDTIRHLSFVLQIVKGKWTKLPGFRW